MKTTDLKFHVCPADAGQIVEKAWAEVACGFVLRTRDKAHPGMEGLHFHPYRDSWAGEWCPANGSPIEQGACVQNGRLVNRSELAGLI